MLHAWTMDCISAIQCTFCILCGLLLIHVLSVKKVTYSPFRACWFFLDEYISSCKAQVFGELPPFNDLRTAVAAKLDVDYGLMWLATYIVLQMKWTPSCAVSHFIVMVSSGWIATEMQAFLRHLDCEMLYIWKGCVCSMILNATVLF